MSAFGQIDEKEVTEFRSLMEPCWDLWEELSEELQSGLWRLQFTCGRVGAHLPQIEGPERAIVSHSLNDAVVLARQVGDGGGRSAAHCAKSL